MLRRARATAAMILAAVVLAGLSASAGTTSIARAATSCPTMQVVGVRGSGQTVDDAGGYGREVKNVVDAIRKANPTAAADPISYPSIAVRWWDPQYYTGAYTASVRAGRAALVRYIQQFVASECGATTFLYLVGYSQGAQVVGDVYQNIDKALTNKQHSRIKGVALIADPKFKGRQGSPINVGSYESNLKGIQGVTTSVRTFSGRQDQTVVRSYCSFLDPVCNFKPAYAAICVGAGDKCVHVRYTTLKPPKSKLTYTRVAATHLISRWRKVGPKPPQVGPRSNILIFGNGDVAESSTGCPI